MTELRNHAKEGVIVAIAGNKCDKEMMRQVDKAEAEKFAEENGVRHFLTSAKTGKGLAEVFQYLSEGNHHPMDCMINVFNNTQKFT